MLNVDAPGVSALQVAHQGFEWWWLLERIDGQELQQFLGFVPQIR